MSARAQPVPAQNLFRMANENARRRAVVVSPAMESPRIELVRSGPPPVRMATEPPPPPPPAFSPLAAGLRRLFSRR